MPLRSPLARYSSTVLFVVAAALGCTSDDVTAPPAAEEGAMTVDASSGWVYVSLADSAVVQPTPSPSGSSDWDIAFNATSVMLNGGLAGPGGVTGACLCQNAGASSAEILAMTPDSELDAFENLNAVPGGTTFVAEELVTAVRDWFAGAGATATADPNAVYLVRLADSTSFAKVHVVQLQNPSSGAAGVVTLEYAVQADSTAAFGPVETIDVDLTSGAQQVDLNSGSAAASVAGWDLELEGFTIRLNGGASGSGDAAAAVATESFDDISTAVTFGSAYRADSFTGIFGDAPWYRYNLAGDNRISPTFDVYLLRRGSVTYAVQIVNYYSATDDPRRISFRFRRIGG
jgi:hypothetical protein